MIRGKNLLALKDLSRREIWEIIDQARTFREVLDRPIPIVPALRGKTILLLFFEPSTRTQISFNIAAKRLSADVVTFSASSSSVLKGETLLDTARNIEVMRVDGVVLRHSAPGSAQFLADRLTAFVVNAGDGCHEHPTQGLLDIYTMLEHHESLEDKVVLIVGDIKHSRVARSNIWGLTKLGAEVVVCGPPTLLPAEVEKMGVRVASNIDEALPDADVVYVLRIQKERQTSGLFPSVQEYRELYGLTKARARRLKKKVLLMHPGPINRGVEIDPEVADGPRSVILDQAKNGVAVRMSVLYLLAGG
ncbi:aspartate carbamoyltransferase [candidate division WOR-3 bacterium]|uniref:Aspartate carbamoyltransferase n=1 Tax=candidate division WOR-3 bacterium TaxID=2052148 RepID=A0A660SEK7_UNCW3|nr:MAG: aspartate carbamoyltransferase [candidate division WOR-3 bacterium]